jgi:hypothetical protein
MSSSKPDLQLEPAPIAPLHQGSIYKTGQQNTADAVNQQMALIGTGGSRRRRYHNKSKKRRKKMGGSGETGIKPQTFPPTYPVPAGSIPPNQNSAAITELYAKSMANSEYDGLVGTKSGGKRKRKKSATKKRHGKKLCRRTRKYRIKRRGGKGKNKSKKGVLNGDA